MNINKVMRKYINENEMKIKIIKMIIDFYYFIIW
jgi:hypothetical protein